MKAVLLSALVSSPLACAHQAKVAADPQMERMAQMHTDMASCLRENKSFDECHAKMMAACQAEGDGACPMMKTRMGDGKMGMMGQGEAPKTTPAPEAGDEHSEHHPEESK